MYHRKQKPDRFHVFPIKPWNPDSEQKSILLETYDDNDDDKEEDDSSSSESDSELVTALRLFKYKQQNQPIVYWWYNPLVYRTDDACLGWWVKCGHFDITYPDYHEYFKDLKNMAKIIRSQNADIKKAWTDHWGVEPKNNKQLSHALNIALPPVEYWQDYIRSDIRVKVI